MNFSRHSIHISAIALFLLAALPCAAHAQPEDGPRARLGLEGGIGPMIDARTALAFSFGGAARAGLQVDDTVAFFVTGRVAGAVTDVDGTSATLLSGGGLLGFDLTFDDVYQIGAGVGLDGMSSSWCRTRAQPCFAEGDPGFAFEVRAAILLAPWDYPMRGGFPASLTWHSTVVDGVGLTNSLLLSIGFELY